MTSESYKTAIQLKNEILTSNKNVEVLQMDQQSRAHKQRLLTQDLRGIGWIHQDS